MSKLLKLTIVTTLGLAAAVSWSARSLADVAVTPFEPAVVASGDSGAAANITAGELPYADLISDLDDSGVTSSADIQDEFSQFAGDSQPLDWQHLDLKKEFGDTQFTLTQIVTRVTDTTGNFDALFTHTLPTQTQPETMVTEYSRRINGAEESTIGNDIVIPRMFSGMQGFSVQDPKVPDATVVYNFRLKPNPLIPTFDLRDPEGTYELTPVTPTSFDPIGSIAQHGLQFTWQNGDTNYNVNVVPREVGNDTLTFEIDRQQVGSGLTSSTVLVYEAL